MANIRINRYFYQTDHHTRAAMPSSFQAQSPWTSRPLIANAAMAGFAGHDMAAGISRAGGIGFIGVVKDMAKLDQQLASAKYLLQDDN